MKHPDARKSGLGQVEPERSAAISRRPRSEMYEASKRHTIITITMARVVFFLALLVAAASAFVAPSGE